MDSGNVTQEPPPPENMEDYFRTLLRDSAHAAWDFVVANKLPAFFFGVLVPLFATGIQCWNGAQSGKDMVVALVTTGWNALIYLGLCLIFFLIFLLYVVPKRRLASALGEIAAIKRERDTEVGKLKKEVAGIQDRLAASFITRDAELRETLYKIRDLIIASKDEHYDKRYDSFGALLSFSEALRSENEVIWICEQLQSGGHRHPFGFLDLTSHNALKGKWLTFLQEARASNLNITEVPGAIWFAAKQWSRKEEYMKGRELFRAWEEANPDPSGIKLLPKISDIYEPKSEEETRNDICLVLSKMLRVGNEILEKCRRNIKVENKEAEDWGAEAGFKISLAAGELAYERFLDATNIPLPPMPLCSDPALRRFFVQHEPVFDFVYSRCVRLRELIDGIKAREIEIFPKLPLSTPNTEASPPEPTS